ncbi:hypothetical protein [Chitinophaga caseinilytica]|uniref:DUF3999 family protein n=1 Tax=Chitinophaga caseinilytica TaxID=2267521 RepID=A0ABZ2Z4N7_9BACT
MINLLKKSCRINLFLLGCAMSASAQDSARFTWEAKLPKVDSFFFYRIPITPALSAKAFRGGEWDIRIFGDAGEVPYLLERKYRVISEGNFIAYATPKLESVPGKETVIVFEPKPQMSLKSFGLRYSNTDVEKTAVLTGSNDGVQWYAIRPEFLLSPATAIPVKGKETIVEQTIGMPVSGYRYFKLVINDSASAPLHFNCVGFRNKPQLVEEKIKAADVELVLMDGKDRRTDRFLLTLPAALPVREVTIPISQPAMYRRDVQLLSIENGAEHLLTTAVLYSEDSVNVIEMGPNTVFDSLVLKVENGDNLPLVPGSAGIWQDAYMLITKLEPGNYTLRGGAAGMRAPKYDAEFFRFAYHEQAGRDLVPEAPVTIDRPQPVPAAASVFTSRWWIWLGIVVVIGVLALVVRGLLRDMKKEKD